MDNNSAFNAAYWASQPVEVQGLHNKKAANPSSDQTTDYTRLAISGFKIDVPIMVDGMDPWKIMNLRKSYGFTWVPSAFMPPIQIAPGLGGIPGAVLYDAANPPPMAITVSTDIKDYPPVVPPTVTHPGTGKTLVGVQSFGNLYLTIPGDNSPGGTTYTDARGTFIKHVTFSIIGLPSAYWELVGAQPAEGVLPTVPDPMLSGK